MCIVCEWNSKAWRLLQSVAVKKVGIAHRLTSTMLKNNALLDSSHLNVTSQRHISNKQVPTGLLGRSTARRAFGPHLFVKCQSR